MKNCIEEFQHHLAISRIPQYMRGAMERWVLRAIPPGDFLSAILANDLKEACARADETNLRHLPDYVGFLYNYAPQGCWGRPEVLREWRGIGHDSEEEIFVKKTEKQDD